MYLMEQKYFTILEIGDTESPMIGTILATNNELGMKTFREKLEIALEEHFDIEMVDIAMDEIPDLFAGSQYDDIQIVINNQTYDIRLIHTWIY